MHRLSRFEIAVLFLALLLGLPIISIVARVFIPDTELWQHLYNTVLFSYIYNSIGLAVLVGIGVLCFGVGAAWLITQYRFFGRRTLEWLLLLPLAMPAYLVAYTYTGMLAESGPLQTAIRDHFQLHVGQYWFPPVRSLPGAALMLALVLYPYVYLLTRAAFSYQAANVLEAARSLGASPRQRFWRVALPLARPAIAAGTALAMMEALADYGTVSYFGVATFTTGIFRAWFGLNSVNGAAQLSTTLIAFVVILLSIESFSRRHLNLSRQRSVIRQQSRIVLHGMGSGMAFVLCALPVILGFLLPCLQLLSWTSIYFSDIDWPKFTKLIVHTLLLSGTCAMGAVLLALVFAYCKRQRPGWASRGALEFVSLGYAFPGTVIALGVVVVSGLFDNSLADVLEKYTGWATPFFLSGSIFVLLFAYWVRFLSVAVKTVDAGLQNISRSLEEAGRVLGRRPRALLWHIHIPLLRRSLLTAALLVFVDVMKELPATLVLRPFNFNTLAVKAFELATDERLGEAAAPGLMILAAGIIPIILLIRTMYQEAPAARVNSSRD